MPSNGGKCVDLDGTINKAGRVATFVSLLGGTTYVLSYYLARNNVPQANGNIGADTVNVTSDRPLSRLASGHHRN